MRILMMVTALATLGACNRGGASNNSAGNEAKAAVINKAAPAAPAVTNSANASANKAEPAATPAAGTYPSGFPAADDVQNGASCFVFLGMSREARGADTGFDDVAMEQSQGQWEASLRQDMSETEVRQLIGSSVNPLADTPAAQRDAASGWCVENAPEVDPEG